MLRVLILVESDDLKLHDSSEDIACARELLTLGQHSEVKRESFIVSKDSSRSKASSAAHDSSVSVQRVIVSRVPGPHVTRVPLDTCAVTGVIEQMETEEEEARVWTQEEDQH